MSVHPLDVPQWLKRVIIAQKAHNIVDRLYAKEKRGKGGGVREVGVWGETVGEGGSPRFCRIFFLPPSP